MSTALKLLLLEDNLTDADLIQTLLRRSGMNFEAIVASDEKEFLEALDHNGYHAVLADNALPQYNSMEALELLRATNPHVAFILVTGTVSEEFAVQIIQQGADDYILKTNLTRLPAAINSAIEKKRIQREKETAVKEIAKEKELSLSIINSLPGIFYLCDKDGKLLRWNKNFERISGYNAAELGKMTTEYFFSGNDKDYINKYMKKSFATGYGETEALFVTRGAVKIPYYFTSMAVSFENKECLICVGIDISSSKQGEEELKLSNEQLRSLSAHLQNIREDEQKRIAREVHDELGQQITGLKMDLSWIIKMVNEQGSTDAVKGKLQIMNELLDETVKTVRRIASQLRPPILDDMGLIAALEWHSKEFEKRFSIPVQFSSQGSFADSSPALTIGLFRLYQESLTNVGRHAKASQVTSSFVGMPHQLMLSIADNGIGFEMSKAKEKKSLGLLGMNERVLMMNGTLEIESQPGEGTKVVIKIPIVA